MLARGNCIARQSVHESCMQREVFRWGTETLARARAGRSPLGVGGCKAAIGRGLRGGKRGDGCDMPCPAHAHHITISVSTTPAHHHQWFNRAMLRIVDTTSILKQQLKHSSNTAHSSRAACSTIRLQMLSSRLHLFRKDFTMRFGQVISDKQG